MYEKKKIIINGIVCFEIGYSLVYIKMEYHTEKKKKKAFLSPTVAKASKIRVQL